MPHTAEVIYLYARTRAGGGWGVRGEGGTMRCAEGMEIWVLCTQIALGSAHRHVPRSCDFRAVGEALPADSRRHVHRNMP